MIVVNIFLLILIILYRRMLEPSSPRLVMVRLATYQMMAHQPVRQKDIFSTNNHLSGGIFLSLPFLVQLLLLVLLSLGLLGSYHTL